jgi:cytidylate kinase
MIITLSGQAGSVKTTVGKLLAKKLKYKFYDIGTLRKQMARVRGMTIEEFNKLGEKDSSTDKDADAKLIEIGRTQADAVIQGRVAYFFVPNSIKIYLTVSPNVAAQRIMQDKNSSERNSNAKTSTLEEIKKLSAERDESDVRRYKRIYGIENFSDKKHYDLVIDTSKISAEQVVEKILFYMKGNGW